MRYSNSHSDICSPLTEVEPDYSTYNSDEDEDEEDDEEKVGVGAIEDGNIYEQVRINLVKPNSLSLTAGYWRKTGFFWH